MSVSLTDKEKNILKEIEIAYASGEITLAKKEELVKFLKPIYKRILRPINESDWVGVAERNRKILNDPIVQQAMFDADIEVNRELYEELLEEHEIMDYHHGDLSISILRDRYFKKYNIID